ncbi:MAG: hypothetical protein IKN77_00945 [Paludibacteraceae bacterium]|nr:hypothetical protein [Paludibacteraceae bacterium]
MGGKGNNRSAKSGTSVGIVTPDMLPPLDAPGGKVKQHCYVLGLGRYDSNGQKATFDINQKAVKKSFEDVQGNIESELKHALGSFYNSDKNYYYRNGTRYTLKDTNFKLEFKIKADVLALNKTEFTYVYKFDLNFSDNVIQIRFNDKIENLSSSLKRFRKDLVDTFNKYIKSSKEVSNKRTENELDLSSVESIITQCNFAELQKFAPVVSALNGKFQLSQVDERLVRVNNLGNRCINVGEENPKKTKNQSGKFNEAVFNMYCDGMSDYDIALDFGVMNLLTLSNHAKGRNARALADVGGSIIRDLWYSFVPGACWWNDLKTIGPGGCVKTQGLTEAVSTLLSAKSPKLAKHIDKWSSRISAAIDLYLTGKSGVLAGMAAYAMGGDGVIAQVGAVTGAVIGAIVAPNNVGKFNWAVQFLATVNQSASIFSNRLSMPQAMLNVIDNCYKRDWIARQTIDVPSHDQLMDFCEDWRTDKNQKINVGVSETNYSVITSPFNSRYGEYEGPHHNGKKEKKGR